MPAARALDHLVWPTRDLDGLASTFRALGFTVGRRNRHPWGTVNHIVQFDGTFLELLGFADDHVPTGPDDAADPFAGFCARSLAKRGAGPAMLVLRSEDAAADARSMQAEGLGQGRLLPFSRTAHAADGADKTVAFTIAFADLPGLPALGAFLCQQHRPENFWSPAAQQHANGACGFAEMRIGGLAATDPGAEVLRRFAQDAEGTGDLALADGSCLTFAPGLSPAVMERVAFRVRDLPTLQRFVSKAGVLSRLDAGQLVCQTRALCGCDLAFVAS